MRKEKIVTQVINNKPHKTKNKKGEKEMRLVAEGSEQAQKATEERRRVPGFGKAWKVGDTCLVYYPCFLREDTGRLNLRLAMTWGHNVESDKLHLKTLFIPSKSEIDENNEVIVPDLAYQFSRIARLFIEGEKELRLAEVDRKNWSKQPPGAIDVAKQTIANEYDTAKNLKAVRPVISGIKALRVTEVIVVPVVEDKPLVDQADLYYQTLSESRLDKLARLIQDKKYGPRMDEEGVYENFIEVMYTFTAKGADKKEAGRVDPIGIYPEILMRARYPEQWAALQQKLRLLPTTAQLIAKRNYSFRDVSDQALKQALTTYCIMNQDYLSYLTEEGLEILEKNASILPELRITLSDPKLQDLVDKALTAPKSETAPTLEELLKQDMLDAEKVSDDDIEALNELDGAEIAI
jgi:hypothetical protein